MKRILLFVIGFVCVSIGALAQSTVEAKYWYSDNVPTITEKVALVTNEPGGLAAAVATIGSDVTMIRVVGELSAADVVALESAPFTTIDLQDAYYMEGGEKKAFLFGNSTVQNLILPDNWSKKEVNAVAEHMPALGSAVSFGTENFVVNGQTKESPSLVAYVKTGNTLYDALKHSYYSEPNNAADNLKLGRIGQYGYDFPLLKSVVISGNPVARDYSNGQLGFDDDGHFVFNEAPVEGPGLATRTLVGTSGLSGALNNGNGIVSLDLSGAYVTEDDLTLSYTNVVTSNTKEVVIPTDPRVTTIPADFLNSSNGVKQICIPSNIQVIRSRALTRAINHIWTNNPNVDEDGNPIEDGVCYDNGYVIVTENGDEKIETRYYGQMPFDQNTFSYGTYTFPAGLKLIESYAFRHQVGIEEASAYNPSVSDVYMLSEIAPECHLDAFHSTMYYGNNTIDATVALQAEGIITREAYTGGASEYHFITILHYPATTTTPNIQRYIDPTRRYSVASTMVDGRGSTVYFPTQTEMIRSYEQAVTGYVWNAWDPTRNSDGSLGFLNTTIDNSMDILGWTAANQAAANQAWKDNKSTTDKTYTSYYDVTLGGDAQPTGLVPYSSVYWDESKLSSSGTPEQQLYPAPEMSAPYIKYIPVDDPESEEDLYVYSNSNYEPYSGAIDPNVTYYTTVKTQKVDADGCLEYQTCDNGGYVIDGSNYIAADNGGFVREEAISGYVPTTTIVEGVANYYSDNQGQSPVTPKVGSGMYFEDGTDNVYSTDPVYQPTTYNGTKVTTYYTLENGVYTESYIYFNNFTAYYNPVSQDLPNYTSTSNIIEGVTAYYSDENGTTPVTPTFNSTYYYPTGNQVVKGYVQEYYSGADKTYYNLVNGEYVEATNATWGNQYYVYYSDLLDEYLPTTQWIPNVTEYYNFGWHQEDGQNIEGYYLAQPQFNPAVYYENGTKIVTTYSSTDHWIPSVDTYYTETYSGSGVYNEKNLTDGGTFKGSYYYVTGTTPKYSSAQGKDYDASETYYSDQNGTEATEISLNDTYYIPEYTYSYREYTSEDGDVQQWKQVPNYREIAQGETGTHCPVMVAAEFQDVLKQNDYRGWHQFILGAYSQNTNLINVPHKSYITDSEWWTICLPYDLRYTDMIAMYGGSENEVTKIPYLSKLLYVVRDVENSHITLMFSKNLMEYKEHEPGSTNSINSTTHVHGVIDDDTKWSTAEIAENPVILHAGVPYLIKPWIPTSSNRQFTVYKEQQSSAALDAVMNGQIQNEDDGIVRIKDNVLYQAMVDAQTRSGDDAKDLIYKGEYEVPAYLINNPGGAESPIDETTIRMKDGSQFTYESSDAFEFYGKQYDMKISSDFTYTFVGTFYLSILPQYSYFLGWDRNLNNGKGGAAFWYNRVLDKSQWAWNNETGIICANWPKDQLISKATSLNSPARWVVTAADGTAEPTAQPVQVANDDFVQSSPSQPAGVRVGSTTMLFGNSMLVNNGQDGIDDLVSEDAGIPDAINGVNASSVNGKWYNVNGQRMNGVPVQSGVYIMNGKKYVVR